MDLIRGQSVNYFVNLRADCHFFKIGCSESSFPKIKGLQCNLPKKKYSFFWITF